MTHSSVLNHIVQLWEGKFLRYPWLVIVVFLAGAALTLQYALEHLKVNTNTADMISTEVPFQKNRIRLETAFPQDISTLVLLIEGSTPEDTDTAVQRISTQLKQHPDDFQSVYLPDGSDFFKKNGLLYLDLDEIDALTSQLARAQPFIGRLAQDNTLQGLFGVIADALTQGKKSGVEIELHPVLRKVNDALQHVIQGKPYRMSWRQLMTPQTTRSVGVTKRFLIVKPVLHYESLMPAEKAITTLNAVISDSLQTGLEGVTVRKTGEVILEHEEMQTISAGVSWAGIASLFLVCTTLWFAYRSFALMFATFTSLTLGLIFSLGFATVAIGELNLISIGFAVLFIGMGDAYSSHFCLRYRELSLRGYTTGKALQETLTSTGSALVLSAITAAIGLFSYIPTTYSGVAELGIIAGASMFIALGTTFTVLPALMKIMPIRSASSKKGITHPGHFLLSNWPLRYAKSIRFITAALGLTAIVLIFHVKVDFNPLNLRDPTTESVQTFKYLLQSEDTTPMTLSSLAKGPEEAKRLEAQFERLATVDRVVSVLDLVPQEQEEKIALIEQLSLIAGPSFNAFPTHTTGAADSESIVLLERVIQEQLVKDTTLSDLHKTLGAFRTRCEKVGAATCQQYLDQLQTSLLEPLPALIQSMQESMGAYTFTFESLPQEVRDRWVSQDGLYRLQIFPKKDLNDLDNLREFILDAQRIDPNVTDLPVTYLESMNEVIYAFQQAFAIAFCATTFILLIVLRNIKDTLLVLLPLLLASLFTAAATVLCGIAFNFANIIALPLLFGLGVDSGIHMVHRLHYLRSHEENLLGTSESQGVFYGALTTVFSFMSLAFTRHQGTASMGLLLSVGLFLTLVCALIVLPAFSTLRFPHKTVQ